MIVGRGTFERTIMFAIFVTINVKPGCMDRFAVAMQADAEGSARDEPGCFRFDILTDPSHPNRVYLYEVYRDKAAFDAHMETPHFKKWRDETVSMFDGEPTRIDMETSLLSHVGREP